MCWIVSRYYMIASLGSKKNFFCNFPQKFRKVLYSFHCGSPTDRFCSTFCHQEKLKHPSYISLWDLFLRMNFEIIDAKGQCHDNAVNVGSNLALQRRSKAYMENIFILTGMDIILTLSCPNHPPLI